jgi:hypothetical protein
VAEKGAKGPIFEGNMFLENCAPKIGANIGAITGILLNTCDKDDGVEEDNNELRRSPRQATIDNHTLTGLQLRPHICGLKKGSFFF